MGDFNVQVGCPNSPPNYGIGKFGLRKMSERGKKLMEFCSSNKLVVTNTFFEVSKRRRNT